MNTAVITRSLRKGKAPGEGPTNRQLLICLVLLTIVFLGISKHLLNITTRSILKEQTPKKLVLSNFEPDLNNHTNEYNKTQERYRIFLEEYNKTLSKMKVPNYKVSNTFIDYGPPIIEVFRRYGPGRQSNKTKTILIWTSFYNQVDWMPETITSKDKNFACAVTTNKTNLLNSDALIFHPIDIKFYPQQRLPHQRWIYFVQEPPYLVKQMSRRNFTEYDGLFNWTATYRWDSDFPLFFYNSTSLITPKPAKEYHQIIDNIRNKKTKLLAIMHRNCKPKSPRFKILAEIRRYLKVDFYGNCGNLSCSRQTEECKNKMSAYKFYLSFENSECRDYISEKVLHPLHDWQAVPVVFGAHPRDYARTLPPNSYIHVKGFSSVKMLTDYITLLDKNWELYEKYHAWRRTHSVAQSFAYGNICEALYNQTLPVKTYRDFNGWYAEDIC